MDKDRSDVVRSVFERVAAKDLDGLMKHFAVDATFVDCAGPTVFQGRDAIRDMVVELWEGFPDFHVAEITNIVGSGDVVIAEFEIAGTHQGTFMDMPPTNSSLRWPCTTVYELKPDRDEIDREAYYYDSVGMTAALEGQDGS